MTQRKPAALSTLSGLLTRPQPNLRSYLVLLGVVSFVQLLLMVVLGGGLTITRDVLERVDTAMAGANPAIASVSHALRSACGKSVAAGPAFEAIYCPAVTSDIHVAPLKFFPTRTILYISESAHSAQSPS